MNLTLTREPAPYHGGGVRGTLTLSDDLNIPKTTQKGLILMSSFSTLENAAYLIPCGTYPLEVTYSPRFKRLMPLVCDVPYEGSGPSTPRPIRERPGEGLYRSGIRFHPGTRPEHSKGCILVSRADEDRLRELIQEHGDVTLKIIISDNSRLKNKCLRRNMNYHKLPMNFIIN